VQARRSEDRADGGGHLRFQFLLGPLGLSSLLQLELAALPR
jgi:hypothetical protein